MDPPTFREVISPETQLAFIEGHRSALAGPSAARTPPSSLQVRIHSVFRQGGPMPRPRS
jgi:hypothetical protein